MVSPLVLYSPFLLVLLRAVVVLLPYALLPYVVLTCVVLLPVVHG